MSKFSPELQPVLTNPKVARRMLDCGSTHFYGKVLPELDSFLDGRSRKITVESIYRYIARQLSKTENESTEPRPRRRGRPRKHLQKTDSSL
jgi:hypothetical protein